MRYSAIFIDLDGVIRIWERSKTEDSTLAPALHDGVIRTSLRVAIECEVIVERRTSPGSY